MNTIFDTFPWPQFEESRGGGEGDDGKKQTSQPSRPSRDTFAKIEAVAKPGAKSAASAPKRCQK